VEYDVALREMTTFGVDARAAKYVRISSIAELRALVQSPHWTDGPRLILGGGSNILLTRDFEGMVVKIALSGRRLASQDEFAWYPRAAAGEDWDAVVRWTLESGWPGLENLTRIPGSVGGAPIQNIGAYGVELKDRFAEVEVFDPETGELAILDEKLCRFAYRDSIFKGAYRDRMIVTSVTFRLPKRWRPALDYAELRSALATRRIRVPTPMDIADTVASLRASKLPDPAEIGNAGSFFKNPVVSAAQHSDLQTRFPTLVSYLQRDGSYKLAAAWLVEQCGWKGRSIGRAGVHDRQSLVLVNRGGASGDDVLTLARAIVESVRARFRVELEPEPVIV